MMQNMRRRSAPREGAAREGAAPEGAAPEGAWGRLRAPGRAKAPWRGPLLSILMCGMTAFGVGALAGCEDESQPPTHVERLQDPIRRTAAVKRLIQFYEDAMTKDKKDRAGENVKPLLDQIVPPLTEVAKSGELDSRAQSQLITFLADTRDPRAAPALIKAMEDYKMDDKRPDEDDNAINDVVRAVQAMKLEEAKPALLKLFVATHASYPKASNKLFYKNLHDAVIALADKSWESQLIALLNPPINSLKDIPTLKDQVFWQTTAATILGDLKAEAAVRPLIKIVLSPLKADIAATAVVALIKIGQPSITAGVKLLNGEDEELMKYAEEENLKSLKDRGIEVKKPQEDAAKKAYLPSAAIIVATIGSAESVTPMLEALEKGDELTKAIIARELPKLPHGPETVEAFKKTYEKVSYTLSIPPGLNAKDTLIDASATFFDADLNAWITDNSINLKGEEADTAPVQDKNMIVCLKIAPPEQMELCDKLAAIKVKYPEPSTIGKAYEKEIKITKALLEECKKDVDCYIKKLQEPAAQAKDTQFQGIKAAYMVGVFGDESAKAKLVEALPKVTNAAVRFTVGTVIDALSPKGDAKIADQLQAIVDKNEESRDQEKISADSPLKTIIHRLRARAQ